MARPARSSIRTAQALAGLVIILDPADGQPADVSPGAPPAGCTCPAGGGTGTPTLGYIVASGTANSDAGDEPDRVFGKIFAPGVGDPGLNELAADPCRIRGVVTGNTWAISTGAGSGAEGDIPCARCGPAQAPVENRLWVWVVYQSGNIHSASCDFFGRCTNFVSSRLLGSAAESMSGMGPKKWRLQVKGFAKTKAKFNGDYTLSLSPGLGNVWASEGDGQKKPRVELSFEAKGPIEWRLVFIHKKARFEYLQTGQNWMWTRGNDLLFTGGDPAKKGVPPKVHVTVG